MVCSVALAACGDNVGVSTTSGARLKLSWVEYDDGTRQVRPDDFYDAEREETCGETLWIDGKPYCTPEAASAYMLYETDQCTTGAYYAESDEPVAYLALYNWDEVTRRMETLTRAVRVTVPRFYQRDGERCIGPFDGSARTIYGQGEAVSRSDLVELSSVQRVTTSEIGIRALASDDGMYLPVGFVDAAVRAECSPSALSPESSACRVDSPGRFYYGDETCSDAVLGLYDDQVTPVAVTGGREHCAPLTYVVGGAEATPPQFAESDDICSPAIPEETRFFSLTPRPVATIDRRRVPAGGRLEKIVHSVGAHTVDTWSAFDLELGEECSSGSRDGRVYRCFPDNVGYVVRAFSDAACFTSIDVGLVEDPPLRECRFSTLPRYAIDFGGASFVHRLGPPRTAPVYELVPTGCRSAPTEFVTYHDLGEAVPEDTFARGTVVRDP